MAASGDMTETTFTGEVRAPDFAPSGLTGATAVSRYVGATASGAPTTGTFAVGDFIVDRTAKIWICTVAGTPGTWLSGSSLNTVVRYHQASGTAQSINNSSTTIINYDTADIDTLSLVTTGASWKCTASATGNYQITAAALLASAIWAGIGKLQLFLYKNGVLYSQLGETIVQSAQTDEFGVSGGDIIPLTATDYLDVRIIHNQGGAVALVGDSTRNYISINRIT